VRIYVIVKSEKVFMINATLKDETVLAGVGLQCRRVYLKY